MKSDIKTSAPAYAPLDLLDAIEWPVLVNNDEQGFFRPCGEMTDADEMQRFLVDSVDRMADCGVTAFSWCLWSWFKSTGRSNVVERRTGKPVWDCWAVMYEKGVDPVEVVRQRCREKGMLFIGGLRMNDRHSESQGCAKGQFIMEHPEYRIHEPEEQGMGVDYRHEAVREKVLECIEDMLELYDLDGLEFDWMRWIHMFEPGTGAEHTEALTDFMRKSRALLDAAAIRRGHGRLPLGVRLPTRLSECAYLGFDVKTWVEEGLADYLCPSCFFRTDFTVPVEAFTALTQGTDCRVYPSTHFNAGASLLGWCSSGDRVRVSMMSAQHRALFRNVAAKGATGIQVYNIFDFDEDRRLLEVMRARDSFRSPAPREYHHAPGFFHLQPTYTPDLPKAVLRLCDGQSGELPFRACEDWGDDSLRASLRFRIFPPLPREAVLMLSFGDQPVAPEALVRTVRQHLDAPYEEVLLSMPTAADRAVLQNGDNTLCVTLFGNGNDMYTVGDLSLWVDG